MCAGLEAVVEGVNYSMGERRRERVQRGVVEAYYCGEDTGVYVEERVEETKRGGLKVEVYGTEVEAAANLEAALQMEVEIG